MIMTRVIIFSSRVGRIAEFYRTAFGFTTVGTATDDWIELTSGGCNLALHGTARDTRRTGDCGIKLVFGTRRVAATRSRLVKLGIAMGTVCSFAGITMCDGRDPDGNRFQISSRGMR
jgi:predicted enzyme related to lactoylglutathione lyase